MSQSSSYKQRFFSLSVILAILFLVGVFFASRHDYIHYWIAGIYLPMSGLCFLAYAKDKWAAVKNGWRVKELTLQLMALFGGWPGALLAQKWLNHKVSKKSFLLVFWLMSLINILLLLLLIYQEYNHTI